MMNNDATPSGQLFPKDSVVIGRVGQPFGVQGWVRLMSFCDPVDNILDYSPWCLRKKGALGSLGDLKFDQLEWATSGPWLYCLVSVEQIKLHGKGFVAKLLGITDRDQAEFLRGFEIVVDRSELPDLPDGDYYWWQLKGLDVHTVDGHYLGVISEMMSTGANDVIVVQSTAASIDDRRRLIPYLPDTVVQSIDIHSGKMVVDWDADF